MMMEPTVFCDDEMMTYDESRKTFSVGESLLFDDAYRLAHLPLVAPGHPEVIPHTPGKDYLHGRYDQPRYSLVVPISSEELTASVTFRALETEICPCSFSAKIQWQLCEERSNKLHATIVNSLCETDIEPCVSAVESVVDCIGSVAIRLGGPFLGCQNTRRIYFPIYPQCVEGKDAFALVQEACQVQRTRFYVVGYYHLKSTLSAIETMELNDLMERWRRHYVAEIRVTKFDVQSTNDDLALSGQVLRTIPLSSHTNNFHGGISH